MNRPGVELAISRSQVRRPNHYTTESRLPLPFTPALLTAKCPAYREAPSKTVGSGMIINSGQSGIVLRGGGLRTKTLLASSGVENEEGLSHPKFPTHYKADTGERLKFHSGARGRGRAENEFGAF